MSHIRIEDYFEKENIQKHIWDLITSMKTLNDTHKVTVTWEEEVEG